MIFRPVARVDISPTTGVVLRLDRAQGASLCAVLVMAAMAVASTRQAPEAPLAVAPARPKRQVCAAVAVPAVAAPMILAVGPAGPSLGWANQVRQTFLALSLQHFEEAYRHSSPSIAQAYTTWSR